MGTIFTSFQSPGKMPSRKDLLNNMVRDGAICMVSGFLCFVYITLFERYQNLISTKISSHPTLNFNVGCEEKVLTKYEPLRGQ